MELAVREAQKKKFMFLMQEVERKRTDLLPEHQKIQKRSQKLQSLQDKKTHHLKEACASEEKCKNLQICEHASRLCRRSRLKAEGLQAKWKRILGSCKLERKGEEVVRRSQTDVVGDSAMLEQSLAWRDTSSTFCPIRAARVRQAVQKFRCSRAGGKSRREGSLGRRLGRENGQRVI